MKTRTLYFIALGLVVVIAAWAGQPLFGIVFAILLAISWQVHALEVRMNKMLDHHNLQVSKEEVER